MQQSASTYSVYFKPVVADEWNAMPHYVQKMLKERHFQQIAVTKVGNGYTMVQLSHAA